MAEEKKQEAVTVVASYMVKHMSDNSVVTEAMKGDITDEQIYGDIEGLGKQVTENKKMAKNAELMRRVFAEVLQASLPLIADAVVEKIEENKVKKEKSSASTEVKKLSK